MNWATLHPVLRRGTPGRRGGRDAVPRTALLGEAVGFFAAGAASALMAWYLILRRVYDYLERLRA